MMPRASCGVMGGSGESWRMYRKKKACGHLLNDSSFVGDKYVGNEIWVSSPFFDSLFRMSYGSNNELSVFSTALNWRVVMSLEW